MKINENKKQEIMNYLKSKCIIEEFIPKLDEDTKRVYAEFFAEGNKELEDFLLYLWRHNINTNACCSGHVVTSHGKTENTNPYISFKLDELNNDLLLKLMFTLYKEVNMLRFELFSHQNSYASFSIRLNPESSFTELQKTFEKCFKTEYDNETIDKYTKYYKSIFTLINSFKRFSPNIDDKRRYLMFMSHGKNYYDNIIYGIGKESKVISLKYNQESVNIILDLIDDKKKIEDIKKELEE